MDGIRTCGWNKSFGEDTHILLHDTGNKTENDRAKVLAFRRFIISIRDHSQLSKLADLVPDPEGGMVVRFFLVIRGLASNVKMQSLNILMLCWSYDFHSKGKPRSDPNATYPPGYTDKVVRQIFKCYKFRWLIVLFCFPLSYSCFFKMHDGGVMIDHQAFENFTGSYWSYFKGRFAIAVNIRSDFGRNPMRASVEYDDELKMRTMAQPPLAILTDYNDNFVVALYKTSRDNMNRGGHEMTDLKRSDYKSYVIPRGVLAGRRCYEPLGTNADKVKKLGLGSNTSLREEEFLYAIVEDPNDSVWSTFACTAQ
jgi:hypothetical protein